MPFHRTGSPCPGEKEVRAKEYLAQIKKLSDIIRIKSNSLRELESAVEYTSPIISDMPRGEGDPSTKRTNALVSLMAAKDELAEIIAKDAETRREAMSMIDSISDCNTRWVLFSRYIEGLSWKDIISRSGYSNTWVFELHGRGLLEIDRRFRSRLSTMHL